MPISTIRAVVLGTLASMLAGSIMAATASAEAGPFWRHRPVAEGEGSKIESASPESFSGTGEEQKIKATIATTNFAIKSPSTTVKGRIFNNEHQGQIELEDVYNQPVLTEPALSGCNVTIGSKNIVQFKGHLMWKWDGTAEQLSENPPKHQRWNIVFSGVEPRDQGTETEILEKGSFTAITLSPAANCGVLAGTFPLTGSEVSIPLLSGLKEWSKELAIGTIDHKQGTSRILVHFWGLAKAVGASVATILANKAIGWIGKHLLKPEQEVAVFEK